MLLLQPALYQCAVPDRAQDMDTYGRQEMVCHSFCFWAHTLVITSSPL